MRLELLYSRVVSSDVTKFCSSCFIRAKDLLGVADFGGRLICPFCGLVLSDLNSLEIERALLKRYKKVDMERNLDLFEDIDYL